jgi:hypothetical protein
MAGLEEEQEESSGFPRLGELRNGRCCRVPRRGREPCHLSPGQHHHARHRPFIPSRYQCHRRAAHEENGRGGRTHRHGRFPGSGRRDSQYPDWAFSIRVSMTNSVSVTSLTPERSLWIPSPHRPGTQTAADPTHEERHISDDREYLIALQSSRTCQDSAGRLHEAHCGNSPMTASDWDSKTMTAIFPIIYGPSRRVPTDHTKSGGWSTGTLRGSWNFYPSCAISEIR